MIIDTRTRWNSNSVFKTYNTGFTQILYSNGFITNSNGKLLKEITPNDGSTTLNANY